MFVSETESHEGKTLTLSEVKIDGQLLFLDRYHSKFEFDKRLPGIEIINIKANVTYIPETYRLYHLEECTEFFELVNTQEFQTLTETVAPQFITKMGNEVHRGRGINVSQFSNLRSCFHRSFLNSSISINSVNNVVKILHL